MIPQSLSYSSSYSFSSSIISLLGVGVRVRVGFLSAIAIFTAPITYAAERLYAYTDAIPEESSWVGQQVVFSVILAMDERPQGSPRFSFPDAPGGILLEVSGRPAFGKVEKDGVEYTAWRYDFAFYPQRDGTHAIPPIGARISLPLGDGTWRAFTTATKEFTLESKWPKGAEGLGALISTKKFEATEKWEPDDSKPRLGDAITRTISRSADDVLGLGFPPLGLVEIDGMGIYPEPPEVKDQAYRGDISGERIEKVTYTFNRKGPITIPGHVIPWFDLGDQQMKFVRFPARTFEVAPNPALLNNALATQSSSRSVSIPWGIVFGALAGIFALAFVIIRQVPPALTRRRERVKVSEPAAFRRLTNTCLKGDAQAASIALRDWLQRLGFPLEQLLSEADDPTLSEQLTRLNEGLYAASPGGAWDSSACAKALTDARKNILQQRRHKTANHQSLNPLNPSY